MRRLSLQVYLSPNDISWWKEALRANAKTCGPYVCQMSGGAFIYPETYEFTKTNVGKYFEIGNLNIQYFRL